MYYIPSAPIFKTLQRPSLLRVYGYGTFLCDRTLSSLSHSTTYLLADIPPRLMITTLSTSVTCASQAQIFIGVDRFEDSLVTPECLEPSIDRSGLLVPLLSVRDLCIKPGDDALLVRMGLVPSISQDSVADNAMSDEDLEIEVFRNTLFDATDWHEASMQRQAEESSLFASASSFFGGILASSSSPNTCNGNIPQVVSSDTTSSSFHLSLQSTSIFNHADVETQDSYDICRDFSSAMSLDAQFSFESDFIQLPSFSDIPEFSSENVAFLADVALPEGREEHPKSFSQKIKLSLDAEGFFGCTLNTSVLSSASNSSVDSFMMATVASMESLIRIPLEVPDLSVDTSFPSSCSLCQLPSCASSDDLVRIHPPKWCEAEDDGDAFEPLPPDAASPFHLSTRLGVFKDSRDLPFTYLSLLSFKEECS